MEETNAKVDEYHVGEHVVAHGEGAILVAVVGLDDGFRLQEEEFTVSILQRTFVRLAMGRLLRELEILIEPLCNCEELVYR